MKKIFVSVVILILILSLGLFAFSACDKKDVNTIRLVEVTHSVFYAPLYIAIENGYFTDEGLTIELTNGGGADKCMTALVSNQADIGLMGPEATIYVKNQGKENSPIIFGQLTKKDGSFLMGRNKVDNFSWDMLRGSEILGGRKGGVPAMTLEHALKKNNLIDGENITLNYNVQFDMIIPTFESGTGDYCTMFEPAASVFVKAGKGHILASVGEMAGDMPFTAFMANKSYIDSHNDQIIKFCSALQKAIDYLLKTDSTTIAELIKPSFVGNDTETLASSIERYKNINAYCENLIMKEVDLNHLQDVIIDSGIMNSKIDFSAIVDNSFAQQVLKKE